MSNEEILVTADIEEKAINELKIDSSMSEITTFLVLVATLSTSSVKMIETCKENKHYKIYKLAARVEVALQVILTQLQKEDGNSTATAAGGRHK